jgi:uncharacterized protein YndB with AHSA1/START domain
MASNDDKTLTNSAFVITRTFKVPRDRVWKAWSEADQLKHWWVSISLIYVQSVSN